MTTSFPAAAWDAASVTRTDANDKRKPDGHDWQRLVDEVISLETLLDSIGVSTAGAFATSDPDTGKRLFASTLVLTLGGNSAAEPLTNVWDKATGSRTTTAQKDNLRAPDSDDWQTLVTRIQNLQKRVQPLGIPATGVLPASEPATGGYLWANSGVVTVSDEAGVHANSLWDGSSDSRPDPDVRREPDGDDYREAYIKLREMQRVFVLADFDQDGGLPTSDPSSTGKWYTSTNIVTVS